MSAMQIPATVRFSQYNQSVLYGTEQDRWGNLWIWFVCQRCGDVSKKRCENAARAPRWASYYAANHNH